MVYFSKDGEWGKQQEVLILPIVKEHFGKEIKQSEDTYAKHDYYCDECNYEVKSRKCKIATYDTTMITMNKMVGDKPLWLIFNYLDCIAVIQYEEEKFAKFYKEPFSRAGYEWDKKEHVYIPRNHLTIIHRK